MSESQLVQRASRRSRLRRVFSATSIGGVGAVALLGWTSGAGSAVASTSTGAATTTQRHLTYTGSTDVRQLGAQASAASRPAGSSSYELPPAGTVESARAVPAAAVTVPNPPSTSVVLGPGGASGFVGITDESQRLAANGNQYNLEPPDQGLCAHGGRILETVNNGLQVYSESGAALSPVIAFNAFFHLPPEINRGFSPPTFGPFLSDPRCYFDKQTGRWFVTELEIDTNPYDGSFGFRSAELLAVSQTSDPLGGYGLFMIDSTNDGSDGTPAEANCPCLGDQPRIGADANGFYISTDSYPIHGLFNSDGGELYALSKFGLAAAATGAAPPPALVDIHSGAVIIGGEPANAVQPAQSPEGGVYASDTEYFLSTPDFNGFATSGGVGAQSVVLWALRGTSTLSSASPAVTLSDAILPSEPFAPPVPAVQKPGPIPLGSSVGNSEAPLSVNDDRMQQVEYVQGKVYSTLNTGVGPRGTAQRSGVAWFVVTPHGSGGVVSSQGYVAVGNSGSLLYPAIGLNQKGNGVMTFSISDHTRFPSAAFMTFSGNTPTGPVIVNGPGTAPEDGFTCYPAEGFGPSCRWGDYSAASSDGNGNIVFADEMIPNSARNPVANWGTFISVRPNS